MVGLRRPWATAVIFALTVSFIAPLILFLRVPAPDISLSNARMEFDWEGTNIMKIFSPGHTSNAMQLNAMEQEVRDGILEPKGVIYKDGNSKGVLTTTHSENFAAPGVDEGSTTGVLTTHSETHSENFTAAGVDKGSTTGVQNTHSGNISAFDVAKVSSSINGGSGEYQQNHVPNSAGVEDKKQESPNKATTGETFQVKKQELPHRTTTSETVHSSRSRVLTTEKIWEMEDQVAMARAYLQFSSPNSNSHLVRELKLRIKEIERVLGRPNKDSHLYTSDLQKMKAMELTLSKARKAYPDCSAMASKLRAQLYNAEEQLRAQQSQGSYLVHLTARTFPKGLHCLSMQLTTEYFALSPEMRELPDSQNVNKSDLYHYAIFSDNVLACAVAVNSTVFTSLEPEKLVFHVVTDSFNFPAMVMWFLLNPLGESTIQIQRMDDFNFLPAGFSSMFMQSSKADPRYTSPLNHLRFYLPEVFPSLNKILLLDHDVVVQRDLSQLWSVDMNGKVNGAVDMCKGNKSSSHTLEMLVNIADPAIANKFDAKTCIWAFGMNIFDLREWRRQGLTGAYVKWRHIERKRQPWKAGSLPLGQLLFYNHTVILDRRWHVFGLGSDSSVGRAEVEKAAVIHYDGNMKPWLDVAIPKHRRYWTRFLDYSNPYFRRCNIHE